MAVAPALRSVVRPIRRWVRRPVARRPVAPSRDEQELLELVFDRDHYLRQLDAEVADPLGHYVTEGWTSGFDPHPAFSTRFYLERSPDVVAAGVCPLSHYVRHGAAEGRQPHPLLDVAHYRSQLAGPIDDPLAHYLSLGWVAGIDPHPLFANDFYLETNPDVAAARVCPLVHYLEHGAAEGRRPHPLFDPIVYSASSPMTIPFDEALVHFLSIGGPNGNDPSEWFDTAFYLRQRPDVALDGATAVIHFVTSGWSEGANPHPAFDVASFLAETPDRRDRRLDPLSEWLTSGRRPLPARADGHVHRVPGGGPLATIVIPLLGQRDDWLRTSVRSALAQTAPCEVIVVASPSTPSSTRVVLDRLRNERGDVVLIEQGAAGLAAAVNAAVTVASTPRVGVLSASDWLELDAVERCLRSTADVVSTARRTFAADGERELVELRRSKALADLRRLPTLQEQAEYLTRFVMIRHDLLLMVGGLDETLGDSEDLNDLDLLWTLLDRAATVDVVERCVYNARDHDRGRGIGRDQHDMRLTLERILDKHHVREPDRAATIERLAARAFGAPLARSPGPGRPAVRSEVSSAAAPTLAVCVLFYERAGQTVECLESLGSGSSPVYVLDNGSSPAARVVLERFLADRSDITLIESPVNVGVAAGRNRLAAAAGEDLLLFLDSDITVRTSRWASVLSALAARAPEVEAFLPRLFDVQEGRLDPVPQLAIRDGRFDVVPATDTWTNIFPGGATCVRRALLERLGGYDEAIFVGLEDYELAIRALRGGEPVRAISAPDVLLRHDRRPGRSEADRRAAGVRYSSLHVEQASERIRARHGLRYEADWQGWLAQQLERAAGRQETGPGSRPMA